MSEELSVEVDQRTFETIRDRAERSGFESAEAYAATVLELVAEELDEEFTSDEMEERLEDLGYL